MKFGFILSLLLLLISCARPLSMYDLALSASMDKWNESQGKKAFVKEAIRVVEEKGDVNMLSDSGFPLFFHALLYEDVETIDLLLSKGSDPTVKSKSDVAAVCGLCWLDKEDVASRVLDKVKDVNQPCEGSYMISVAASLSRYSLVKQLVERGARIDVLDYDEKLYGWSPLMWAVNGRNDDIIKLLLEKGADINFKSKSGETALSVSKKFHFTEIEELLKQKGAKE